MARTPTSIKNVAMSIFVGLAAGGIFLTSISPDGVKADGLETGEYHIFDCGENEPPSGPYLNFDEMAVYDYNCQFGTMTFVEETEYFCLREWDDLQNGYQPIAGFCAIVNPHEDRDAYKARIFMAAFGSHTHVTWDTHTHDPDPIRDGCERTEAVDFSVGGVSYYSRNVDCYDKCHSTISHEWWADAKAFGNPEITATHHASTFCPS